MAELFQLQQTGTLHPYTCGKRDDGQHEMLFGDLGTLIPTTRGWICPYCDYTQNWCHDTYGVHT